MDLQIAPEMPLHRAPFLKRSLSEYLVQTAYHTYLRLRYIFKVFSFSRKKRKSRGKYFKAHLSKFISKECSLLVLTYVLGLEYSTNFYYLPIIINEHKFYLIFFWSVQKFHCEAQAWGYLLATRGGIKMTWMIVLIFLFFLLIFPIFSGR